MHTALQDLRHAVRLMGRAPGFTFAALATLTLAIGVNTAVFSVVYGILLRPLPYPGAERIVRLSELRPGGTPIISDPRLSNLTFDAWRNRAQTIESLAVYNGQSFTLGGPDEPSRIEGAGLSPTMFALLGVSPQSGRFFREEESVAGANRVVVLSHGLWQRRFGGNPSAIGRTMELDGEQYEIIGVAPAWFYFPDRDVQLWTPYVLPTLAAGKISIMTVLARLKPGATVEQAVAEGTAAARTVAWPMSAELMFGKGGPVEVRVRNLVDQMTSDVRPAMLVLMAAVGLILIVACANVANLLLARGIARSRELAVRAALGAGRMRLARQLLTESIAFGLAGGLLGVFMAWALMKALPAWAPAELPRLADIRLDTTVLFFSVAVSLLAGILAGILPALRAADSRLTPDLRSNDQRSVGSGGRARGVLLAAEAAVSVVLLIGAALLIRSFVVLINVNPGFDTANVLTGRIYISSPSITPERRRQVVEALVERVRSSPGVTAAGAGSMAPLNPSTMMSAFSFRAKAGADSVVARVLQYHVTPGYAEALGLRLVEGRFFAETDSNSPLQAMAVNEAFVQAYVNDGQPVAGRRYQGLLADPKVTTEIVGVVGNVLKDGLDRAPRPEIYLAHSEARGMAQINLVVKTSSNPNAFVPALRSILRDVEPTAALGEVGALSTQLSASVAQPRFATAVLAAFATLALALAATGLYGVLTYSVSQRRREIGIRSALGATKTDLIKLIVRQGLASTLAGLALGVVLSLLVTRLMQPLLFGITPLDWPSFAVMPIVLLGVALVACLLPARNAAATDPAITLRGE